MSDGSWHERAANHGGGFYYCVKTSLSDDGAIYVYANITEVAPDGTLVLSKAEGRIVLALAKGQWEAVYAASVLDAEPVAVTRWEGEVVPP